MVPEINHTEKIMASLAEELGYWRQRSRHFMLQARKIAKFVPPPGENWHRAGGGCVCELCGLTYLDHPEHQNRLHVLCDGRFVKL